MAELVELLVPAALALCVVRFLLIVKRPSGATLPHPSKVPGLPMTGPASIAAAHAAITRRAPRPWWRVW
jgi:hypothetical protein